MDLLLLKVSFTIRLSETIEYRKVIIKKLKSRLRNMLNKSSHMKEFS